MTQVISGGIRKERFCSKFTIEKTTVKINDNNELINDNVVETVSVETIGIDNAYSYIQNNDCEVYDVNGKLVNLDTSKQGIYFIVKEDVLLCKVWKQ